MAKTRKRRYESVLRRGRADGTRRRIVEVTRRLLGAQGYAAMTIDAIARGAEVSPQTVYAIFKSKTGILAELLDQATFGEDYEDAVQQALGAKNPETALRFAARIARQIHGAQSATFDLLRGAGVVAPELAKLEQRRERIRYIRQEDMIVLLRRSRRLRAELDYRAARDVLWMLTGRDVYRMLVCERGWSPRQYESWLADTLARVLLAPAALR